MYRVYFDKDKNEFKMKIHSFDKGICGYVGYSGTTCFIDNVDDDNRYCKEVDDPLGTKTHQIIAVPVFCYTDKLDTTMSSLSQIPRAVISIIDKKDPNGFVSRVSNNSSCLY